MKSVTVEQEIELVDGKHFVTYEVEYSYVPYVAPTRSHDSEGGYAEFGRVKVVLYDGYPLNPEHEKLRRDLVALYDQDDEDMQRLVENEIGVAIDRETYYNLDRVLGK